MRRRRYSIWIVAHQSRRVVDGRRHCVGSRAERRAVERIGEDPAAVRALLLSSVQVTVIVLLSSGGVVIVKTCDCACESETLADVGALASIGDTSP